jgi:tRNA(Ile)-lysidine synthase
VRALSADREAETAPDLNARVGPILDRQLSRDVDAPLAVALSGGGDSLALLMIAADWAKSRGRRLVALSVDHRVHADSVRWTAFAHDAALRAGADWRGLVWEGEKPKTGLQAAAREARHALIADAAREAGASVVLFAHTIDDVREAALMRDEGSTLGRVREWSPSPAWPQGRGVFLLRPLLDVGRAELRAYLRARGLDWIDDPANADLRYARSRARAALDAPDPVERSDIDPAVTRAARAARVDDAGAIAWPRGLETPRAFLAAAVLCAAGATVPPRGDQLDRIAARLASGESFTATLRGARIDADPEQIRVVRDAGETARGGLARIALTPGCPSIWDGRFEVEHEGGGEVRALKGLAALLTAQECQEILGFAPHARPALPVLIPAPGASPVLAARSGRVRVLVGPRLWAACGLVAQEAEIANLPRGADPIASLC